MAAIGDKVIIISYAQYSDEEAKTLQPTILFVDENNRPASE
jgi:aspartate 1-decarboxylase